MNAKLGETVKLTVREQSVEGVFFNVFCQAAAVNTTLNALTDFISKEVSLKCTLMRGNKGKEMISDNLQILGIYSSLNYGLNNWYKGNVIRYKDVAVKEQLLISLYVPFGGIVNVKGSDILTVEVTCGLNVFGANIDSGVSFVEFDYRNGIGYEMGVPVIRSQVVTAGVTQDKYSFGDNITKLMFINLDKTDIENNVITTLTLDSVQLSQSMNFFTLLNNFWNCLVSPVIQYRYGATQPFTTAAPGTSAQPFLPAYPQSVVIFAGTKDTISYIDNTTVAAQFNSEDVASGKNYFVSTTIELNQEAIMKANERAEKHASQKESTLPVTA